MNREIKIILTAKTIKGNSFVGIDGYTNSNGGVSNKTIQVGLNFDTIKLRDAIKVTNFDPKTFNSQYPLAVIEKAKANVLKSLVNPSKVHSDAQKNAYTHIAKGIKVHNETGKLYISGIQRRSHTTIPGTYKAKNQKDLTLAQNEIKEFLNLDSIKYVTLPLENTGIVNLMKISI